LRKRISEINQLMHSSNRWVSPL